MRLDERFATFKRMPAPDLWPDIERREHATEPTPTVSGWGRFAIALAALVIGTAGVVIVVRAFAPQEKAVVPTTPNLANGVIAYSPIGEQHVFWTIRPDGTGATKVRVDVPGFVGVPSWSPDGSRITFSVNSEDEPHPEGGNWDIYVANADGSIPTRLTGDRVDHSPVWSPDGRQIAYVYGYGEDQQIRVMNADGSDTGKLTSDRGLHLFPSWSPDGSQIAFVAFDGTNANVYVMNADGSGARRLTNDSSNEDAPAWSPDGSLIAFTSEGGARDPGVYVMSADGTGVTQLAHDPDPANLSIAWSPDGAKMALVSIRGPGYDRNVYVLDVASRAVTSIGQAGAYYGVSWQPVQATTT
jgi:Tol biopolymer transport system component